MSWELAWVGELVQAWAELNLNECFDQARNNALTSRSDN